MTIAEVKKGLLLKMQEAFPKETYKYYAMEVKEGFTRPSFFYAAEAGKHGTVQLQFQKQSGCLLHHIFSEDDRRGKSTGCDPEAERSVRTVCENRGSGCKNPGL